MSAVTSTVGNMRSGWNTVRDTVPSKVWGVLFLGLACLYPFLLSSNQDLLDASIQTLAYIIMALGLNIVVGFAGLLDLGYVAFYAIGAFVVGWFASQQFPDVNGGKGIHILVNGESPLSHQPIPGIHINFFIVAIIAAAVTALWGVILGAPTLRLRGDYLAIVTLAFGEIVPRIFENGTSGLFGIGSTDFSNGRQGITPIDKINLPWKTGGGELSYPLHLNGVYFVALLMVLITIFINVRLRDSRLGPRVDRRPRGRGRRRSAWACRWSHQAARLRDRRRVRRRGRRVPRRLPEHGQRQPVPVRVLDLRPRDGHPRRPGQHLGGGDRSGRCRSSTRA